VSADATGTRTHWFKVPTPCPACKEPVLGEVLQPCQFENRYPRWRCEKCGFEQPIMSRQEAS
jgi:predicted RNA-binding Zn-ribbon protein involved in translation (DUF1610 family)